MLHARKTDYLLRFHYLQLRTVVLQFQGPRFDVSLLKRQLKEDEGARVGIHMVKSLRESPGLQAIMTTIKVSAEA